MFHNISSISLKGSRRTDNFLHLQKCLNVLGLLKARAEKTFASGSLIWLRLRVANNEGWFIQYINLIKVSLIPRRELNYVVETEKGEGQVVNLLKSLDASARESLSRGARNAVNESKKAVNCCVRVDGGI